ncbi:MAG TPA: YihY/virulence factor BrkB family protein [Thermomicrobiales bacterium]|nr:YihY/virulence factor BrkB family protein [Thermomicrobiales bacterium]
MTSAQQSDRLPRAGATGRDLRTIVPRLKDSISSAHAALLAKHASYAVLVEIVQEIRRHQPSQLAKQSAYSLLYAVPSVLIVLVSLAAIVDKNTGAGVSEALRQLISEQAPAELQPLLASLVQRAVVETSESQAVLAVLISLAIAIWGGAGGVGALIDAINGVYDVRNTRSFIKETALKLGLMLLGGALVIGSFILLTFGRLLGEWVAGKVGRGDTLVNFLSSGPIWALFLLACSVFLLYWLAPDVRKSIRWVLPGTALATLAVLIIFAAMDLLLRISNPGSAFGAVGSVLILLWTLFLVSAIVIVGGIVNAVLGRRYDRTLRDALRQPEKRPQRGEIVVSEYR